MFFYLYRLAVVIAPLIPPRVGYWIAARIGDLAFYANAPARKQYAKNLRRVVPTGTMGREFDTIVRNGFENLVKNYFDLFRGHSMRPKQLDAMIEEIIGMNHLESAFALKRGVLGGASHFGNFDMVIHLVANRFREIHEIVVPMEHLKPEKLHEFVLKLRSAQGIEMVAIENAPRAILKALRGGNFVGLAIDRDVTESGTIVNFFGQSARLPDGGVQLALKFNIPFIVAFSRRTKDDRSVITIEPPLWFEKTGNDARDVRAGVEKVAQLMEKWFRAYPSQWLMFIPFWENDKSA